MNIGKGLSLLAGLVLLGSIIWASTQASLGESFQAIIADPWGVVTLIDLYVGFILASIVIWTVEESPVRALLWIAPIYFLGNVVTAVWLAIRLGRIMTRPA